jgi:serine phosphatase RsbU (regulator of sigma subunit)
VSPACGMVRIATLPEKTKLLWVSNEPAPDRLRAAAKGWDVTSCHIDEPLEPKLGGAWVAVVSPNGATDNPRQIGNLLGELDRACVLTIFLVPRNASSTWKWLSRRGGQFLCIPEDAAGSELSATLEAATALRPVIRHLQGELAAARSISNTTNGAFEELDEQMRLAARLQRDFLPRRLPEVEPVHFGVFYRPVSWVSGDIYDVTRLDETHVGFYVADAIGHGIPAALLTMFIKKALQTKRITGNTYEIIPPHVSLEGLNTDICQQNLSICQFCTAIYCIVDTDDLTLTYSRAGHPEPILIHPDGSVEELTCPGSLLGIFPEEQFESRQVVLSRGDRLLLYTDGAEHILQPSPGNPSLKELLRRWADVPQDKMLLELTTLIEETTGPNTPDDVTVLVMDITA